jgi:hypothetical protein
MKVEAAVYAIKYEWQDEPKYHVFVGSEYNTPEKIRDMAAQEYLHICPLDFELTELSPHVFRARQVAMLRVQKEAIRDVFVEQSTRVQDRIENLLAIGDESHEG